MKVDLLMKKKKLRMLIQLVIRTSILLNSLEKKNENLKKIMLEERVLSDPMAWQSKLNPSLKSMNEKGKKTENSNEAWKNVLITTQLLFL
jgi:hypothetical protein